MTTVPLRAPRHTTITITLPRPLDVPGCEHRCLTDANLAAGPCLAGYDFCCGTCCGVETVEIDLCGRCGRLPGDPGRHDLTTGNCAELED